MGTRRSWRAVVNQDEMQEPPQLTRELLARVWSFARPYAWLVLALLLTILFTSGLALVSPQLFRLMIDEAIPQQDMRMILILAAGMMAVPLISGIVGVLERRLTALIGQGLVYDMRCDLYQHLQRMSLRFFTQTRTGELMSRLNNDVLGAKEAINETTVNIITDVIKVISTLAIMVAMDWRLTAMSIAILPLFLLPARHFAVVLRELRRKSMEYTAEMNASMHETLNVSGALLVKLFGQEEMEYERFSGQARQVQDLAIQTAVTNRWFLMMISIVTAVGTALVFGVGGYLVLTGAFTVGTIVAFGAYLRQLYAPLQSLTNAPVAFAQSMVSFERVFEVLDLPVEIRESPDAMDLGRAEGRIEFRNVCFSYQSLEQEGKVATLESIPRYARGSDGTALLKRGTQVEDGEVEQDPDQSGPAIPDRRWALENLSFTLEPGQLAALVGPSGAGKSTITYLIPRLYDPTSGRVSVDGKDLKQVTLASLADNIGMVTQETFLFYDTILANLLYANPGASEAQVIEAAKAANIHDFISDLPEGYDTVVGERGYRLSGGERQRIAIARVILMDPRILVLDEATSSLDSISEALVQEALQRVMAGRTSLVIAHRLSTVLSADTILVMQEGNLVEKGSHQELRAQGGLYCELYETQFKAAMEGAREMASGLIPASGDGGGMPSPTEERVR